MSERSDWPIVVGGSLRSGTSLVRRILDSHPRIHCGPEIKFFSDFYGDYRNDALAHVRFARTIRDLVPETEALDVLGRAFVELHERAARRAGKARWADKAPENVLHTADWGRLLHGWWLFVHVVRNPLDTVASMRGRFPLALPTDVAGQTDVYKRHVEAGLAFEDEQPDRCYRIVYEELCTAPEESVERLMAWLGESGHPIQLRFNDVPHQEGLEDPEIAATDGVHAMSVGRWTSVLSEDEAAYVWARTQELWDQVDPAKRHPKARLGGC